MTQEIVLSRKEYTMLYAGLDWADDHHDVVVIDEAGHKLASKRVNHTKERLDELIHFLESFTEPDGKDQLACIAETNRGLLIAAMLEAGFSVYPVNPKVADRRRGASGAKTDQIDAYLLAKLGRAELPDLRRLQPDSPIIGELKELTRDQDALIQMQTRLVNQLTACLKAYSPVALQLFTKLQQRSTLIFLQTFPTPATAAGATVQDIERVLKAAGHPTAHKVAPKIHETLHQPQLTANALTPRTKSRLALAHIAQLLPLLEQIAAYEKEIERLFLTHEDHALFESLPGAGKRLAPRLLAELGDDRSRYTNCTQIQALAGTAPVLYQSGNYLKAHRRHACLKPLRNTLYQLARTSRQQDCWADEYYQRKRAEGKSHSVALRALSNVWVRILYRMWNTKTYYDPAIFGAARQAHAPRAVYPVSLLRGKPACFFAFN
jgi:transposase